MKTSELRTLVIGGGSGIRLAVARRLARDNTVVIAGRDQGRLDRATAQTPGLRAQVLDVASEESTRRAIDRVADELGGLDLVIHAAGAMDAFDVSDRLPPTSRPARSRSTSGA